MMAKSKDEQVTSFDLGIEFSVANNAAQVAGEGTTSEPPSEFLLIPDEPTIYARDGRVFRVYDRTALLEAFAANQAELPIDVNHNEFSWSSNVDRRAYGWIGGLEAVGNFGIKATKVVWTELGIEALTKKFYRYISGAFAVSWLDEADGTEVALITRVLNAGLVNRGAMVLPALASERRDNSTGESTGETMTPKILQVLGLLATATETQVCEAIATLQQKATATTGVDPLKFAPIEDYRVALARAERAESELRTSQATALASEAKSQIDLAISQGKAPPSMRPMFEQLCSSREGLEAFKVNMAGVQPIVGLVSHVSGGVKPPGASDDSGGAALTSDERAIAKQLGISDDEYLASKKGAKQ
jgi:phage I-like protein